MPALKDVRKRTAAEQKTCDKTLLEVRKHGIRRKGMAYYEKFLAGGKLTPVQTIITCCWRCNGYGELTGCAVADCPLYPYYMQALTAETSSEIDGDGNQPSDTISSKKSSRNVQVATLKGGE